MRTSVMGLSRALLPSLAVACLMTLVSCERGGLGPKGLDASLEEVAKRVENLNRPAILIRPTQVRSSSYLGGLPPNLPGFDWPLRGERPLAFLACIDLHQVPRIFDWLPSEGKLLFFYDMEEQPWGFDPKDRGGWRVVYLPGATGSSDFRDPPDGLDRDFVLSRKTIRFEKASLPPSWEDPALEPLGLSDSDLDLLIELRGELYGDFCHHQMGGYPDPIQSPEMQLECQLASNGLFCGDSSGYEDPRAKELEAGVGEWRLLLQIDTDDDLDLMWGDCGILYFWVKEQEARAGNFDNCWVVLQCY